MEECTEVAKEASKALRFGLLDSDPNDPEEHRLSNSEKITKEIEDLYGVIRMLHNEYNLDVPSIKGIDMKVEKIKKYLKYSAEVGTLKED